MAFVLNFVFSLSLTSFELNLDRTGKGRVSPGGSREAFDSGNSLNRKSFFYSKANVSNDKLTSPEMRNPSVVKMSFFLILKLLVTFQIIFEVVSFEGMFAFGVVRSCLVLGTILLLEMIVKWAKKALDVALRLNVNFFETRAFIGEKNDFLSGLLSEERRLNQDERLRRELVDDLNRMRIGGNVKKEFILRYFSKRLKNLSHGAGASSVPSESRAKVFTAYRNEDMMRKDSHSGKFVYHSPDSGRKLICLA